MELFGYSERGLVNALCYDCIRNPQGETYLAEMLRAACFPLLDNDFTFTPMRNATFLVEQSLSRFGDCDLIILSESEDATKSVLFCEFKRGRKWSLRDEWKKFTVRVENKIRENLTSNLYCQLYFKQRFVSALAESSSETIIDGLEFDEPLRTKGGNGRRRIGNNKTVGKAVEMIRPYALNPYFLMVTPQTIDQTELRPFMQQINERPTTLRDWSIRRWGHLSLSAINRFCEHNRPSFDHTLSVFEFNDRQLY